MREITRLAGMVIDVGLPYTHGCALPRITEHPAPQHIPRLAVGSIPALQQQIPPILGGEAVAHVAPDWDGYVAVHRMMRRKSTTRRGSPGNCRASRHSTTVSVVTQRLRQIGVPGW
ncbi:hypothetical protein [Nocardia sp. AB354]|uniref:hypothetical protein n=1 Tax=Nocardia sp. AB354 TaxID=3413283 RepID=UPI003C29B451